MPSHATGFGHIRRIWHVKLHDDFATEVLRHANNDFVYLWTCIFLMR